MKLFSEYQLGDLTLNNRVVMAPMTRSRAIDNIPNSLMATYYGQRAAAGLIITEGTAPSANGLGYTRIPGMFSADQIAGWQKVTEAVHAKGGKIFVQLMHTGRAAHPDNMPDGAEIVAPSAIALSGDMYTDTKGPQPHPVPREMTAADIDQAREEYVQASRNAIMAGFDGVELHGANGYLIEQFLNPASNQRTDDYGGSVANRNRFAVEVARDVAQAIGANKTGIRLSPFGVFNDISIYEGLEDAFVALAAELKSIGLIYLHLVDHSTMGTPEVPAAVKQRIRDAFGGSYIASGGLDTKKAEAILQSGEAELTAFGRPYLANPDLVHRLQQGLPLNEPDHQTFYTPGEKGYTDYPLATA
ncbi:MAG: alkene reductase [Bacteroidota bacterium]